MNKKLLWLVVVLLIGGLWFLYDYIHISIEARIEKAEQYLIKNPIEILDITKVSHYLDDLYQNNSVDMKYIFNARLRSAYEVQYRAKILEWSPIVESASMEGKNIPWDSFVIDDYYLIDPMNQYIDLTITMAPNGRFDYFEDKNISIMDHMKRKIEYDNNQPRITTYDYQDKPVIRQKVYTNHYLPDNLNIFEQYYFIWYPPLTAR